MEWTRAHQNSLLLNAWEQARAVQPIDRTPTLLLGLGVLDGRGWEDMTVGECDRQLLDLRVALFGSEIEAVSSCPYCAAAIEANLSAPAFGPYDVAAVPVTVVEAAYEIECRVPLNRDLSALARLARPPTAGDLLERCVVRVVTAGREVAVSDVPEAVHDAVLRAVAQEDPGAEFELTLRCPECDAEWLDALDIREFLWTEVTAWVNQILDDVAQLAQAYGWSEKDILAMSDWRRFRYLEAVEP